MILYARNNETKDDLKDIILKNPSEDEVFNNLLSFCKFIITDKEDFIIWNSDNFTHYYTYFGLKHCISVSDIEDFLQNSNKFKDLLHDEIFDNYIRGYIDLKERKICISVFSEPQMTDIQIYQMLESFKKILMNLNLFIDFNIFISYKKTIESFDNEDLVLKVSVDKSN